MDAVYMVRPGPVEELRYSLRSLAAHVEHDRVFIFGSAPSWVAKGPGGGKVTLVAREKKSTKYATTTGHLRAMCKHAGVSDPFVLWMDDVYAVRPVGPMPALHLGDLDRRLERYVNLRSTWATGMRATARMLHDLYPDRALLSYETHAPLIVHKAAMLEALALADQLGVPAPHKRTIYGNVAELGGIELAQDPKWVTQAASPPKGSWLSSDDASFRSLTKPVLRWLFPDPCAYEIAGARSFGGVDQDGRVTRQRGRASAVDRMEQRRAVLAKRRAAAESRAARTR